MKKFYTAADGTQYPVEDAQWPLAFDVKRADYKKAVMGHPLLCVEAVAINRNPNVKEAYIGSGRIAYVVFAKTDDKPATAVRFTMRQKACEVRDAFDLDEGMRSYVIWIGPPNKGDRLSAKRAQNRAYKEREEKGTVVRSNGQRVMRFERIGVSPRPRPCLTAKKRAA